MSSSTIGSQSRHPKGLYLLFFTEMWERFSYYGMKAIFTLFMINALLYDKSLSSVVYGNYTGLVYLTPLIGGYVADRYWGNRRSIFIGGVMMAIGQFFMFLAGTFYSEIGLASTLMFAGLGFLIFGNGFFKPNISTMVGQLYPEGDKRVDSAFTIFYMGINLGAFIAPLVCGGLGEVYDSNGLIVPQMFKWGFLAAAVGMVISIISFELLKHKYIITPTGEPIGNKPKKIEKESSIEKKSFDLKKFFNWSIISLGLFVAFKGLLGLDLIGAFIYTLCIIAPASIIVDKSLTKEEKEKIWVIFIIAFFVIFFWSAFEQAGASLTFFAQEQTDRSFFDSEIPSSYFQSVNAVAIVIFAPIFAWIWTKLGSKSKEPSSPVKQALGLFLLAVGYLVIALGVKDLDPSVKVSMFWLITLYTIHTFGELCLSPIGLSMVVKLAPVRFASLLMGVWFLSTATANKFAGDLSSLYPEEVKLESTVDVSTFNFSEDRKNTKLITDLDSNFLKTLNTKFPNQIAKVDLFSDNLEKEKEKSFLESFKSKLFGIEKETIKDSLKSITLIEEKKEPVSEFLLKQIVGSKPSFVYTKLYNSDNTKLSILKYVKGKNGDKDSKVIETWNIKPKKPSFLGVRIENLYNFFMIFVFMAGGASIILFLLSKKLTKMMHGIN